MSLRDAALGFRIAATIPYVWLRTRLLPLPRALAGLTPDRRASSVRRCSSTDGEPASGAAARIIRLTDRLLERRVALLQPSCMLRSLVLYRFLREAGIPVQVNFGIARDGDALKGHSWLTLDGLPYAEPVDPTARFHIVYRYPADSAQRTAHSAQHDKGRG